MSRWPAAWPALHGLIDQLPATWTEARRAEFIDAFLLVLDLSVDCPDEDKEGDS